jgi:hypothetical protein
LFEAESSLEGEGPNEKAAIAKGASRSGGKQKKGPWDGRQNGVAPKRCLDENRTSRKRKMIIPAKYYRLPPSERQKVMHDQPVWDEFRTRLQKNQPQAMRT